MCQISRATVLRANRRMIERGKRPGKCAVTSDGKFHVSVVANGRVYTQTITNEQIREAYGKALEKKSAYHVA